MHTFLGVQDVHRDGHDDLALARAVARNVAGELVDVGDQLRLLGLSGGATYATAKVDCLAGYLTLEGPQEQGGLVRVASRVADVKA